MIRRPPASVVVLGGGTAGWMAANLLAHRWAEYGTKITVVESPDIGIIGVGEGSTPQLKHFFETLGIVESEWMPRCNATYKAGIQFANWSHRAGFSSYFHPFPTALDPFTQQKFFYNTMARRTGRDVMAHPDHFFLPTKLAQQNLAPLAPANFPFHIGYGYHFDAHLVGDYLRHYAKKLGVLHLQHIITGVTHAPTGEIATLKTSDDTEISAEFFIDSSGFSSFLLQQALAEPFVSYSESLFNDRAVVMPTPAHPSILKPFTTSTAASAGWIWDIPLTTRTGNGYVHASAFISADAAETELRRHLTMLESPVEARHLKMKVGRVRNSWVKNVLAVGLAQGFIEPLEATALHIVQTTVETFLESWGPQTIDAFNHDLNERYDGIRDYIVCHYKLNQRSDTAYWRENAQNQNLSTSLKSILTCWYKGQDLTHEINEQNIASYYASLSWHCLLAGYGTFPEDAKIRPPGSDIQMVDMAEIDSFLHGCSLNFTDHKQLLNKLTTACASAA